MRYELGQSFTPDPSWVDRAIHTQGPDRWHALITPVMNECQAEAWLKKRGVYSFHPIQRKTIMRKGKIIDRKKRYLPGYVFARFPGPAIMHKVLDCPFIADVVKFRLTGHWAALSPEDLRHIHAMRDVDADRAESTRKARLIKRGDKVRILQGPCGEGQEVEVLELRSDRAIIKIRMFGADMPAEVKLDGLEKISD